jgi:uncharacterized protein (DUF4415 family)
MQRYIRSPKFREDSARASAIRDEDIDLSDIPELTGEQLAAARRPARQLVAARLDKDVMEWLQSFGPGYSTRINTILRAYMERKTK